MGKVIIMSDDAAVRSAFHASACARVIDGFWRDVQAAGDSGPVMIMEFEARTGEFAYRLVGQLASRFQGAGAALDTGEQRPFIYVLAHRSRDELDRWQNQPRLARLIELGWLDVAEIPMDEPGSVSDPVSGSALTLRHTDLELSPEARAGALVILANQLFGPEQTDPNRARSWLRVLRSLSECGLLLCAESVRDDAGRADFEQFIEYVAGTGGLVVTPSVPSVAMSPLALAAVIYSDNLAAMGETVRAFEEAMSQRVGPSEWHALEPLLATALARASVLQLCAYVRASGWDQGALSACVPHLLGRIQAGQVSDTERGQLRTVVEAVWGRCLPVGQAGQDVAFAMGLLMFGLGYYRRAAEFFEDSLVVHGPGAAVYYNLALCAAQLGHGQRAIAYIDTALAHNPGFAAAHALRLRVMGSM